MTWVCCFYNAKRIIGNRSTWDGHYIKERAIVNATRCLVLTVWF
jgi:hypothetical protein